MPDGSASAHRYRPKLLMLLEEGYSADLFRKDIFAALTVAIVALPLSMAIAVASGVSPERGLYTAIIGGALVSALGGSRYQIGGPAGAFIVLVSATVTKFGLEGLLLAVFLSGLMLTLLGLLKLGTLIRYIPHAVTTGFTCGIALIILASQIKDLAGLTLNGPEPGNLLAKLYVLAEALHTLNPFALALGIGTAALIFLIRKVRPNWPGLLIAVLLTTLAAAFFHLPVETIGSRFGDLPNGLPAPHLPNLSLDLLWNVLPVAFSFTLLGGLESLLSAKVADGMTRRRHRSNMELIAQGVANVGSALFGGISVTGTIARTATNIRAGARTPLSGILHSAFLLLFLLLAAPLASFIPLSALAGILAVVCWTMAEKEEFLHQLHNWRGALVLLTTFTVTVIEDLIVGIVAGCAVAAFLAFITWFHQRPGKSG